jgi:uroporphyrinogen III methyltransferase/synthase
MNQARGKVYLLGAGPGAPDLITVRAARALTFADVVIYDSLVNPELLNLAPKAKKILVGKRGGTKESLTQESINELLLDHGRRGRRVARLKGGDPFLFGRGGEEAEALVRAGIPFEIVPGISSALAAPAYAGIPLTHREYGSFVIIATGHEDPSRDSSETVPWSDLAQLLHTRGTLVILMGTARLRVILAKLSAGGLPGDTPAAAVQWGSTAAQKSVLATMSSLADEVERLHLGAPAVVVVGECAGLHERLQWFENLPLFGRRIVVTRAAQDAPVLVAALGALGADVIEFPTIETAPPTSFDSIDQALERAASFDWIIFTSARGVDALMARIRDTGRDLRNFGRASIATIGPATAARARYFGLRVDAIPAEFRAEAIIGAIGEVRLKGAHIMIPRAEIAREILPQMLIASGAAEIVVAPVYRTVLPGTDRAGRVRGLISAGQIDCITFTSSSTVDNFHQLIGDRVEGLRAAVIGPITAATARAHGFEIVAMPHEYTIDGLISALTDYFRQTSHPPGTVERA